MAEWKNNADKNWKQSGLHNRKITTLKVKQQLIRIGQWPLVINQNAAIGETGVGLVQSPFTTEDRV